MIAREAPSFCLFPRALAVPGSPSSRARLRERVLVPALLLLALTTTLSGCSLGRGDPLLVGRSCAVDDDCGDGLACAAGRCIDPADVVGEGEGEEGEGEGAEGEGEEGEGEGEEGEGEGAEGEGEEGEGEGEEGEGEGEGEEGEGEGEGEGEPLLQTSVPGLAAAAAATFSTGPRTLGGAFDVANSGIAFVDVGVGRYFLVDGDVTLNALNFLNCGTVEVVGIVAKGRITVRGVVDAPAGCANAAPSTRNSPVVGGGGSGGFGRAGSGAFGGPVRGTFALVPPVRGSDGDDGTGVGGPGGMGVVLHGALGVEVAGGLVRARGGDGVGGGGGGSGGAVLVEGPAISGIGVTTFDVDGGNGGAGRGGRGRVRVLGPPSLVGLTTGGCAADISVGDFATASKPLPTFDFVSLTLDGTGGSRTLCNGGRTCFRDIAQPLGHALVVDGAAAFTFDPNGPAVVQLRLVGEPPQVHGLSFSANFARAIAARGGQVALAQASGEVVAGPLEAAPGSLGNSDAVDIAAIRGSSAGMATPLGDAMVLARTTSGTLVEQAAAAALQPVSLTGVIDPVLVHATSGDRVAVVTATSVQVHQRAPTSSTYAPIASTGRAQGAAQAVAFDGDIVAVGVPFDDRCGDHRGFVDVYRVAGGALQQIARLTPRQATGSFGKTVSLAAHGTVVVLVVTSDIGVEAFDVRGNDVVPRFERFRPPPTRVGDARVGNGRVWMGFIDVDNSGAGTVIAETLGAAP
jgi:hypothetical protein